MERRIPVALIEDLVLTRELAVGLGVSARDAFALARRLLGRDGNGTGLNPDTEFLGSLPVGDFVQLGADVQRLRLSVQQRLETAIESTVRRPRGRPPRNVGALRP